MSSANSTSSGNTQGIAFKVSQFRDTFQSKLSDDLFLDQELENQTPDISTDDVKTMTKFEQIEQEIRISLTEKQSEAEEVSNKQFTTLEENAKKHLSSFSKGQADFLKNRKKEINFLGGSATTLQVAPPTFTPVYSNEVVLSVTFYHAEKGIKSQEFLVLGSQPLTELRDAMYCLSDIKEGAKTRSAYFFIENVFYNDLRDKSSIDYSKYVIDWSNDKNRYTQPGLGIFSSKSMSDQSFNDLTIRLGAQYLFVHQGNCEHIVVFTDLRLLHDQDNKNRNAYPVLFFQSKIRRKKCRICDIYSAKYMTFGDKNAPENPCFWCDSCYRPFHYSAEGNLLYDDFQVFPYYHE